MLWPSQTLQDWLLSMSLLDCCTLDLLSVLRSFCGMLCNLAVSQKLILTCVHCCGCQATSEGWMLISTAQVGLLPCSPCLSQITPCFTMPVHHNATVQQGSTTLQVHLWCCASAPVTCCYSSLSNASLAASEQGRCRAVPVSVLQAYDGECQAPCRADARHHGPE